MNETTTKTREFVRGLIPMWAAMATHLSLLVAGIFAGKVIAAQIGLAPNSATGDMVEFLTGVALWAVGIILIMEILKKKQEGEV